MCELGLDSFTLNDAHFDVVATISSPELVERVPSDLVVVVDVSGSMGLGAKVADSEDSGLSILDIVKHAVKTIINTLNENDRLSLISFSNQGDVIFELLSMNTAGRENALRLLETLESDGSTNLWDGLRKGLQVLNQRKKDTSNRNSAVLLLTDGEPNVEPPRGHIPALQHFKEKNGGKYSGPICTFGFGYVLDSALLKSIADEGGGSYCFIPDAGFVGTAFVNALANILVTVAQDVEIELTAPAAYRFESSNTNVCKLLVPSVQGGQSRNVSCKLIAEEHDPRNPIDVTAVMRYHNRDTNSITRSECTRDILAPSREVTTRAELVRLEVVAAIRDIMALNQQSLPEQAVLRLFAAIDTIRQSLDSWASDTTLTLDSLAALKAVKHVQAILHDMTGQVTQATTNQEFFQRWGRHYLPSLGRAHELQQCNNFKDPGVQGYGGAMFVTVRDDCDDTFSNLPAPRPAPSKYTNFYQGGVAQAAVAVAAPVLNMNVFNNRDAGCFHEDCVVNIRVSGNPEKMSKKRLSEVVRGDVLEMGDVVECVMKTLLHKSTGPLAHFPGGLVLTPYHPVLLEGRWEFPCESQCRELLCETRAAAVYSLLIRHRDHLQNFAETGGTDKHYAPTVTVNGMTCAALAHGIVGDAVASHPFFGTNAVVEALQACKGWSTGLVVIAQSDSASCMTRDPYTGLINGILEHIDPISSIQ